MRTRRSVPPVMPLSEFSPEARARVELLASGSRPPPRWLDIRDEQGRPIARIASRAYYEWHMRRGRDIRLAREKIPRAMRLAVIARDGLVCGLCGGDVARDDVHIDHIRPVCRGGRTVLSNLRVAHSRCNLLKGADWMEASP